MADVGSLHLLRCSSLFFSTVCHTSIHDSKYSPFRSSIPFLIGKRERGFLSGYKPSSLFLDSYSFNSDGILYFRCDYILKASVDDDDGMFSEGRRPHEKMPKKNTRDPKNHFESVLKMLGDNLVKQERLSDFSDGDVTEESASSDYAGTESDSSRQDSDSNEGTPQKDGDEREMKDDNVKGKYVGKDSEKLKDWQLRRLAYALKTRRRKIKIKKLCDDVCLKRSIVLNLLREPSIDLLMMSATLPDEPELMVPVDDSSSKDIIRSTISSNTRKPEPIMKKVSVRRPPPSKRGLKKNQILLLERLYRETRWPNVGTMNRMSNLIKLSKKKVLEWFEKKRSDKNDVLQQPYAVSSSEWKLN